MKTRKNLLFVFADQWRAGAMGAACEDPVLTPNMDAFCEDATYCDHAFSTFPVCSPHRASLLTGKYPLSLGMFTNCKNGLSMRLKDEEICIGQVLKQAGYQTAYIGKWHLDEPEQNHCSAPLSGARDWDAFTPPGVRRHGFDYWYSYGTYDMHLNPHYWQDTPEMICPGKWSVEHETEKAMEYLEQVRRKDQPFALYLAWNPPHSPYDQVPQKYLDLYPDMELKKNVELEQIHHHTGEQVNYTEEELKLATRQYYAAVSGLDEQFGRLIRFLKEQGLYENTVIVLSSDHGDMMGSHGLMGKHVWYEEAVRIPFVVRLPGNQKRVCHTCIASQDMMPTVLGLLDVEIPDTVEGEDCSAFIMTPKEDRERVSFLCACPGREVFLKKFQEHGKDPKEFGWRGVRTQRYTYVMELGYDVVAKPARYLYDIGTDVLQQKPLDLVDEKNRKLAEKLEADVMEWMERQKDGFAQNWIKEDKKQDLQWERFCRVMAADPVRKKECAGLCRTCWPDACSLTLKTADELLEHTFLFQLPWDMEQTQEPVHFSGEIDWKFVPDEDKEFVFQMNRHRYWICLGQAYALTGEEKYAQEFVYQLLDWQKKEPWQKENENLTWRTLDAGLRADHWVRTMALCADSPAVTKEVVKSFLDGLSVHAKRLFENPREGFSKKSNWGIMEYAGLYLLGFILENEAYIERSRQYLKTALHVQIMDDGMQWEASPMYHNEVLMAYLEVLRIARIWNDMPFSQEEMRIIEKMARATMLLQTPTHCQPMAGDSDNTDVRDILSEAALLLENGELKAGAFSKLDYESIWLFGGKGFDAYENIKASGLSSGVTELASSGQVVVRSSWGEDADWLYFKNGPLGGGHGHQDKLHIGLWLNGEEVLTDSGRFTYKDVWERHALKSAQAHNVPMVRGQEYVKSVDSWIYDGLPCALPNTVCQKGAYVFLEGAHAGYAARGIVVRRRIVAAAPDIYVISDTFVGEAPEEIAQLFHFGESIHFGEKSRKEAEENAGSGQTESGTEKSQGAKADGSITGYGIGFSFVLESFAEGKKAQMELVTAPISRHYNQLGQTACLSVSAKDCRTLTTFLIRRHGDETVRVVWEDVRNDAYGRQLPTADAEGYVIEVDGRKMALVLMHHEPGNDADYNGICGVYGLGRTMVCNLDQKEPYMTILQW